MAVNLSPVGGVAAQFFTSTGAVLTGGKLYTYLAGTTTPATTYTTSAGNVAWSNPIVLDAAGRVSSGGEIWITSGVNYKFVLKDSNDVLIATYDNVSTPDASNISYTAPYTGAVTTTVKNKLAQTVSVIDFGADPTGTADSTAAFTAALAASKGVVVPVGTFKVTGFTIPTGRQLSGLSQAGSIIQSTDSTVVAVIGDVSDVVIENLTINSTGTSYGNTVYVGNGASNVTVQNCIITSAYRTFMAGDPGDAKGVTYIRFLNNRTRTTSSDGGIRTRKGADGSGGVMWFVNNLIVNANATSEDVGIETWTPDSTIEGNVIVAENLKGGFSGITFGVGGNGVARNNRITGFSAGIEMGSTGLGLHVIDGNIISNCKEGILVSSGGLEESVTITNNQITMDEINRNDYTYAIYVQCQAATITNNAIYYKNGSYTYTSALSRKATGIRGDTNNEQMLIVGNVFKNLVNGIDLAATGKDIQVVANDFYNVYIPLYDTGGSPNTYFCNNNVQEFAYSLINLYGNFSNNEFARSSDYPNGSGTNISSSPFVESLNSANVTIVNSNNRFTNVLGTAWSVDGDYYLQGSGYGRPKVEVLNGTYKVSNSADPSAVTSILTTCGFDPTAKNVVEWFTGTTYVINSGSTVTTQGSAVPTTGTWKQGDIVWKTTATSGATPGWVCTVAGTPGTWKAMANLA